MKNKSIWENKLKEKKDTSFFEEINTDILIIGGGITGVTLGYFFNDYKGKITLIDKQVIGGGITSKTTAKITYIQQDIYQKLENKFSTNISQKYFKSQKEAINLIKKIIEENNINCDLKKIDSILFTTEENNIKSLEKEKSILESFGVKTEKVKSEYIKDGFKVEDGYIFHPLKYLEKLKEKIENNIDIYENTLAYNIKKEDGCYLVLTSRGKIKAKKVAIACHYPFFVLPNFIPLKTYIKREYVCSAEVENSNNFMAINLDNELHSIRFYKNYLIYGSNGQRLTSKLDYQEGYNKSREDFKKYFHKEPEYVWMNQDIVSNDLLPFIGIIDDDLYLSTAYNAWGMSNGTIGAKVISDLIIRGKSKYQELFDPKRMNLKLLLNSLIGSFHYMKAYTVSLIKKNNPSYVKIKGLLHGVYIDDLNEKHIVKLICPHFKCHLVFNKEEKTWDCPCHGSRFDIDGNIIEGPSVKKI